MDIHTITPRSLAIIDHTFLKPFGSPQDTERLCAEARQYGFAMIAAGATRLGTSAGVAILQELEACEVRK